MLTADTSNMDNPLILFTYPSQEVASDYLRPTVQLELGARGDTWPAIGGVITPYAADHFPGQFQEPTARVRAITPERTFWEKATFLHALAHQDAERARRARPARHYYDVYRLWEAGVGRTAARDVDLLAAIVKHKSIMFRETRARYDLAVPGSLRLAPDTDVLDAIRPEYRQMAEEMIFGEAPTLDQVVETLREIERVVNSSRP